MRTTNLLSFAVFLSLAAGTAWAQAVAGLGGISGTVRDATGSSVPDAIVAISNGSKGIRRSLQTTSAGVFSAPALVPASGYTLSVTKPGFITWQAKDVEILVG